MSRFVLTAQLQLQAPTNVGQVVRQIQNQLNNVQVNVQVQGAQQAQRQIQQVARSTDEATDAATKLGKSFGLSIKRFAAFSIATRAVSLFTSTLSKAVEESIAFERELIKISQVTGKTLGQLRDLTSEITRLSTSLGVSSTSLLGVSRILSQAGLNADETRIALDALAKSELAPTFDDIQQTAEGVVAVFNQFQQGAAALEAQLGSINAVAGKFAVEAGDLISVVRRTGGVFKAAGGDLNELIALFTSVRATTRESAESIATGLRTIFTRIQRPQTIEFLRQYGVELLDLEGKFVGPFEATKRLSEALAGLEQGDITFVKIAEELGGFRQIGKVIPLLQQFSVAQEALNVAQKGSGSLADDAAKAQLALAVRITKVKEEFLALVRSITETTSFQLFANTALNLASALIKLADALKPIIPLLTAFAGIKLATGVGSFIRGIGGGLRTPRGFATGGLVPGSGNRDTVPAMLTPGEFVIKKSSVAKLGAGNLAAMNENRYAAGGIVTGSRHMYGDNPPLGRSALAKAFGIRADSAQYQRLGERSPRGEEFRRRATARLQRRKKGEESKQGTVKQVTIGGPFGASFLRGYGTNVNLESRIYDVIRNGNKTGVTALKNAITQSTKLPFEKAVPKGAGITVKATQGTPTFLDPKGSRIFDDEIMNIIPKAFDTAAKKFNGELSVKGPPKPLTSLLSKSAISSIEGQFFEAYVRAITNNVIKDEGKKDAIFDFSSINQEQANKLFGTKKFVIPNEFKNDPNPANIASILAKAAGQVGGIRVQKFATGGAVGTDTVPALLTPGEFVINRSSAQKIGYGSLNRMNKVGKYAKGGVVQKFARGTSGRGASNSGGAMDMFGGLGGSITLVTASLQAMLPPLDENSSAISKVANNLLTMGTVLGSVIFALEAFGINLSAKNLTNIFGSGQGGLGQVINQNVSNIFNKATGKLGNFGRAFRGVTQATARGGSGSAVMRTLSSRGVTGVGAKIGGGLGRLVGPLSKLFGSLISKLAGPLAGLSIVSQVVKGFRDLDGKLKDAIKAEDTATAQQLAVSKAASESIPLIGDLISGIGDMFGSGTSEGILTFMSLFGGPSVASIKANINAQIESAKAQKSLKETAEKAAEAMKEFEAGNISAAEAVAAAAASSEEIYQSRLATEEANKANTAQRSEGGFAVARNIFSLGGLLAETSGARNRRIEQENQQRTDQQKKLEEEQLKVAQPAINALGRQIAATGGGIEEFRAQLKALGFTDDFINRNEKVLTDSFNNIAKEAERTRKAFDAMNLGFQNITAVSGALSVSMNNYLASQEAGFNGLNNTIALLEASVTNAAQGISDTDFNAALGSASDGLRKLGANDADIAKFEENLRAINTAQKLYTQASEETKNRLVEEFKRGAGGPGGAGPTREKFAEVVADQLAGAGIGEEARNRIKDALSNADISQDDLTAIMGGNMEVLDRVLQDLGETTLNQVIGPLKELAKYNQQLADITKRRLELENRVVEAQKDVLAAQLEAQEIAAKYGGAAVTPEMRRQNIIGQANIEAQAAGVSGLQTGSAAELNQRNREIRQGLGQIGQIRAQAAAGNKQAQEQLEGQSGVKLAEQEKRLQELAKSEYETTKQLIGLKEEELKLIQEKNRLEKSSIEALVTGDIDKFFEQQAAVGATAAIALGNQSLMGAFGPDALGAAALDIQKQQEAGVQSLYGQQLGGPGGLVERGFGAAISARGVSSPLGMAQVAAGTTAEEEAAKSEIRDLAATLPNYAETQLQVANQDLNTANIQMQAAEMQLQAAKQNAKDRGVDVAGMARGGPVYANNGIFVPRGTDTVPAMLTPGEFVVRRAAVQRGNNLQILQAMNRGQSGVSNSGDAVAMNSGGVVRYRQNGSNNPETSANVGFGISPESINQLTSSLNKFNTDLSANIDRLNNTTFNIKLDNTNINVNLTGTSFLATLKDDLKQELYAEVGRQLSNSRVGDDGKLKQGTSVV